MKQFLIAADQLANTLIGGYADETLSARAHRVAEGEARHGPSGSSTRCSSGSGSTA